MPQKGRYMNQKYLKDENGEVFSPITSIDTVYNSHNQPVPQIVAWCYAVIDIQSRVVTIKAGSNIDRVTINSDNMTFNVYFNYPIKDAYYSVAVSFESSGIGREISGVYDQRTDSFKVDCANYLGQPINPTQFECIIVR